MTQPRPPADLGHDTPLPPRLFRWYITFWHVVYLGVLALILGLTLWQARAALGWREAALTVLVLGQAALYLWNFILTDRWPLPNWRLAVYFLGSIALWLVEWWIAADFGWVGMAYFGQMFGVLPPLVAVPGTLVIFTLVVGLGRDLDFSIFTTGEFIGPLLSWASTIVFYLFVYYVTRTSSQRGALVQELRAAQAALEAAREHDAELAALRERERLARDLHDSLGHALVAISVQLEAIQRLYRVDPDRAAEQVDALKGVTRAAMDELRRSLAGLRAPGLGDRPLPDALRTLAVDTGQRTGLNITCRIADGAARLTPAVAETLWRVAQESLTNIERHATARHVDLHLEVAPALAVLRVRDDGRGLPARALGPLPDAGPPSPGAGLPPPGHYGLHGLRERLEGLGGQLTLTNLDGLTVEASVPLI